jgi:hypothetical protein
VNSSTAPQADTRLLEELRSEPAGRGRAGAAGMLLMAGLLLGGGAASQGSTAPAAGMLLTAGLLLGGGAGAGATPTAFTASFSADLTPNRTLPFPHFWEECGECDDTPCESAP